jgi:putative heme transporter
VPFALPLAIVTFFAGFFPIVGAVTAGALAVLVALATEGPVTALILLGVVIAVQQLEGNLLEPVVMGRAVHLHPVVILLALGAGAAVAGIVGAFLAVPLAAAGTAAGSYLWSRIGPEDQREQPTSGAVTPSS